MQGTAHYKNRNIRWTGLPFPEFVERAFKTDGVVQTALLRALVWWRQQIGPLHFEEEAHRRYGGRESRVYADRTAKYNTRKLRKYHHLKPLVFTGQLRREFLRGSMKTRVTGSEASNLHGVASWPGVNSLRSRGKTPVPYVFAERTANSPIKYAELTVMNDDDERELLKAFEAFLAEEMAALEQGTFVSAERVEQFAADFAAPGAGFQG